MNCDIVICCLSKYHSDNPVNSEKSAVVHMDTIDLLILSFGYNVITIVECIIVLINESVIMNRHTFIIKCLSKRLIDVVIPKRNDFHLKAWNYTIESTWIYLKPVCCKAGKTNKMR